MKVDAAVVQHIARLAKLRLDEAETVAYAEQLSRILDYVEALSDLDTSGVEPFVHPVEAFSVFRSDKPIKSYPREDILANAPEQDNGYFKVPKVVE